MLQIRKLRLMWASIFKGKVFTESLYAIIMITITININMKVMMVTTLY